MNSPITRLRDAAREQQQAYAQGEDRPLGGYLVTLSIYGAIVAGLGGAVRATGRDLPEQVSPWDLALLTLATHKLARIITKESVTSPLRAPFTRYQGPAGEAELHEEVRGEGLRHSIGELVTCPFCLGQWVATGFVAGLVFAPRATRLIAATFATLAGSDLLQLVYAQAKSAS
jgi:Protein of unknown function (DUF1360)